MMDRFTGPVSPALPSSSLIYRWLLLTVALWLAVGPAHPGAAAEPTPAIEGSTSVALTRIRDVLNLSRSQAERSLPVRLTGVVTCSDPRHVLCFIHDSTGGVYIYATDVKTWPKVGDRVQVEGSTGPGMFSPIIMAPVFTVLGRSPLPPARPVSIEEVGEGGIDSQWVEVTGVVRSVRLFSGVVFVEIAAGLSRTTLFVIHFNESQRTNLVGALVRVKGVVGSSFDESKKLRGFHTYVNHLDDIEVLNPAPADPFALPTTSTRDILRRLPPAQSGRMLRIRARVILRVPGSGVFLQDDLGGAFARTGDSTSVQLGDLVDAVGFPGPLSGPPLVEDASLRLVSKGNDPLPADVSIAQILEGEADGRLVRLNGRVTDVRGAIGTSLWVSIDHSDQAVQVQFPSATETNSIARIPPGTSVRVKGVCTSGTLSHGQSRNVLLLARNLDDLQIVELPGVWHTHREWLCVGSIVSILLGGGVWFALFQKRVRLKTSELEQSEKQMHDRYIELYTNSNDIIYRHDLTGKILDLNRAGLAAFECTREEALSRNIFDCVTVEDRSRAKEKLQLKLSGESRTLYEARVLNRSGMVIIVEVNSRIQLKDGKPVAVEGIARDITKRKRDEQALRDQEQRLRGLLAAREKLGRDLHDGIIQSIYAVGLALDDGRHMIPFKPDEAGDKIGKCLSDLNAIIREVRAYIAGLEPESLDAQELKAALKSLVMTMNESGTCKFSMQVDPAVVSELSAAQATHLLFVAREAMSNTLRHSGATNATIVLKDTDNGVMFEVRDQGRGFNPDQPGSDAGRGLKNIAARAKETGANFSVDSAPGQGTTLRFEIPC